MGNVTVFKLHNARTTTGSGPALDLGGGKKTFQAYGTTTAGAGAATIKIQVSNDDSDANWLDLGTITLTLATTVSNDGFASTAAWKYVKANVTVISGTGASVTVNCAAEIG